MRHRLDRAPRRGGPAAQRGPQGRNRPPLQPVVDDRPQARAQQRLQALADARPGVVQRAPWQNEPAKFRTDNDLPDIPNSEYLVDATGYKRYAPINEIRAPGQLFHEGPRSFAYVYDKDLDNPAYADTQRARTLPPGRTWLKLTSGAHTVIASRVPRNGLNVWDADVTDAGEASGVHPGHQVSDLGQPLPHLDSPEQRSQARSEQTSVWMAQILGILPDDHDMRDDVYAFSDDQFGGDDNAALRYLADHPEELPELQAARAKGRVNAAIRGE